MFTTLLESTPHKRASGSTAGISFLVHSLLIAAAVYVTASGDASKVVASAASRVAAVHWVTLSPAPKNAPAPAAKPKPKSHPVVAPKKVPTATPPIDQNARPTVEPESGPATTQLSAGGAPGPYNAFEVDVEAAAMGGASPQYPEALRSSGIEGKVIAQFVVNEKGRADEKSFKVLSSTHPLFAEAVRRALPQMRFRAAKIGGNPVSQLVQQLFVFKLDR